MTVNCVHVTQEIAFGPREVAEKIVSGDFGPTKPNEATTVAIISVQEEGLMLTYE